LTFRLRILFLDDRFSSPAGGKDSIIDPICSTPSAMGAPVPNPQIFPSAAGVVPDGSSSAGIAGDPLLVSLGNTGEIILNWGSSCNANDPDYSIYEGVLGDFTSHTQKLCTTAGATSTTLTPAPGNAYYLVVPRNSHVEGSYGFRSDGSKRLRAVSACVSQQNFACGIQVPPATSSTDPATEITIDSASMNGSVNPNGFDTEFFFEWGTTTALGNTTRPEFLGNGSDSIPVFFDLTGLAQNTTYYYRIVSQNPVGSSTGSIVSFGTPDPLAS